MVDLVNKNVISSSCKSMSDCEACLIGKSHNSLHKISNSEYSLLELVIADI